MKKLINKIFKPDFVAIGNVVFRRDEILSVGIESNLTKIIVTYRNMSLEPVVLHCESEDHASEHMKIAAQALGLKLIKQR